MAKKVQKAGELRQMSEEQLGQAMKDTVKEIFQLRCRSTTERTAASSAIREQRRHIARINTIKRERELAAGKTALAKSK